MKARLAFIAALISLAPAVACTEESSATCDDVAVAFVGALSGTEATFTRPMRDGAQLAVQDHNDRVREARSGTASGAPGSQGCEIGFVEFDTQGDPTQAASIARQVVDQPDIVGIVGPTLSGETGAIAPIVEQAGLAFITPSATNAELGTRGWATFHRMVTNDATQGPAAARYLVEERGLARIAVIDDGSLYGDGISDLVASTVPTLGGAVVARLPLDPASRDYTAAIREIISGGAQAVFYGGTGDPAARAVRQLREAGSEAVFAGADGIFSDAFVAAAGPAAEGAVVTCPCAPSADGEDPAMRLFASRFLDTFGMSPGSFVAEGYDAATVMARSIDVVGGRDRAAVLAQVDAAQVDGVTGPVSFDDTGEVASGPVYLYEVRGGRFAPIGSMLDGDFTPITAR